MQALRIEVLKDQSTRPDQRTSWDSDGVNNSSTIFVVAKWYARRICGEEVGNSGQGIVRVYIWRAHRVCRVHNVEG